MSDQRGLEPRGGHRDGHRDGAHLALDERRRAVEARLGDLRRSLDRELGRWAPKKAVWAVPLVAFACGLAAALALRKKDR